MNRKRIQHQIRPETQERIRRYRDFATMMKWMLPALLLLLLTLILLWPTLQGLWEATKQSPKEKAKAEKAIQRFIHQSHVIKPHYHARNAQDQPYDLRAEQAVAESEEKVSLIDPTGEIALSETKTLYLHAEQGQFTQKDNKLELRGDVVILDNAGNEFHTESSSINLKEGTAYTSDTVYGEGPMGTISADSFYVEESGKKLTFKGHAKIIIMPSNNAKKDAKP